MDSLGNIISRYVTPEQPELTAIKHFISKRYGVTVQAAISGSMIVVTVPSAALANTLRLQITTIKEECKLEKRLIFRIG